MPRDNIIPFGPSSVEGRRHDPPAAPYYLEPQLCSECGAELEADTTACLDPFCPIPITTRHPFIEGIESAVIVTGFAILGIGAALMVLA